MDDAITGREAELYAAVTLAQEETRAAEEQRRAVEAALGSLQQVVQRMDAAVRNLSAAGRVLQDNMEQAARAAFASQADDIRRQVAQSIGQLQDAAAQVRRKVFLTRWSELAAAFLLGVLLTTVFGYFQIQQPLRKILGNQVVLYEQARRSEARPAGFRHRRERR